MRHLRIIALIVASLMLGSLFARYLDDHHYNIPGLVESAQWGIGLYAPTRINDPYEVVDVADTIQLFATTFAAGIVLCIVLRVGRVWLRHRQHM